MKPNNNEKNIIKQAANIIYKNAIQNELKQLDETPKNTGDSFYSTMVASIKQREENYK